MKRVIAGILVCVGTLADAGCGGAAPAPTPEEQAGIDQMKQVQEERQQAMQAAQQRMLQEAQQQRPPAR